MALVAYSDESDISDQDEDDSISDKPCLSNSISFVNKAPKVCHGIESIEDEDDFHNINSVNVIETYDDESSSIRALLASIPAVEKSNQLKSTIEIEASDVVDDVPTIKSWHINEHTKVDVAIENKAGIINKKLTKRKFILPALSEFKVAEEEKESNPMKKMKPSSAGCGLMALLPSVKKPQTRINSLVPDSVKKIMRPPAKPSPKPKKAIVKEDSDSDDDFSHTDFFTFEDKLVLPNSSSEINSHNVAPLTISEITPVIGAIELGPAKPTPREKEYARMDTSEISPSVNESHDPLCTASAINETDLIKLTGRRNMNEIVNLIDVNADDALMSRHEWMTRALVEEKPKMSYSKKKSDGPSQQSKRKHQITYLAHQAKEREQELQNNWATARHTKSQTQAKYGF